MAASGRRSKPSHVVGTGKPRLLPVLVFPNMDTSQPQFSGLVVYGLGFLAFNQRNRVRVPAGLPRLYRGRQSGRVLWLSTRALAGSSPVHGTKMEDSTVVRTGLINLYLRLITVSGRDRHPGPLPSFNFSWYYKSVGAFRFRRECLRSRGTSGILYFARIQE